MIFSCIEKEIWFFNITTASIRTKHAMHYPEWSGIALNKKRCYLCSSIIIYKCSNWIKLADSCIEIITYLHVKCNHLGSIHPTMHWVVIRGLKAGPSWVNSQQVLLSKPRESHNISLMQFECFISSNSALILKLPDDFASMMNCWFLKYLLTQA